MRRKGQRLAATAMALALIAAACGDDDDGGDGASDTTAPPVQESIGEGEGALSVLTWPYYAEDGTFTEGLDWVTPFEEDTGCDTTVKYFANGDEAYQLFGTGDYDVVSPSGDQSMRMVAAGYADPINTDLIENYGDLAPFLVEQDENSLDGVVYGIPHGWGANVLQYNTDVVDPAPTSWGAVFDPDSPYAGKIAAYDSPIYIADAALYLMNTQPDLGIENPYALDQEQFDAAIELLQEQNGLLSEYWSDYVAYEDNFRSGSTVLGTSWQIITKTLQADPSPVDAVLPEEGSTAWSDNWMIHSDTEHPNCAYEWINYITSPSVQATVSSTYGEAPANLAACTETLEGVDMAQHCEDYHADDQAYYDQLWYWTTPTKACLDGRTDVECKDYAEWVAAWTEVKG
jgi:putative spermidine/putrescine transport system substrate-binding protein